MMIDMVKYEIKKILSKVSGKVAVLILALMTVITIVSTIYNVDYVNADGTSIRGYYAAQNLRNDKDEWKGYLTEEVFAEVIRENARVELMPEAQSKDWHDNNKAYSLKQGYIDIRNIINSALSPFREYNYYSIDEAEEEVASEIYSRRISSLQDWLNSNEAKDRYTDRQKVFIVDQYNKLETPLYYEDADGWIELIESSPTVTMLMVLILGFLVCGIFTGEFQLKADAVFFSATEGREKGIKAKMVAGFVLITILYWIVIASFSIIVLTILGFGGWNSPIQSSLYGWKSIYNITFLVDYLLIVFGGYIGTMFILEVEMLISVITRSAVFSMTIPFILIFAPSLIANYKTVSGILGLMPDQMLQVGVAVRYFNVYEVGNRVICAIPIMFIIYICMICIIIPLKYFIYKNIEIE